MSEEPSNESNQLSVSDSEVNQFESRQRSKRGERGEEWRLECGPRIISSALDYYYLFEYFLVRLILCLRSSDDVSKKLADEERGALR